MTQILRSVARSSENQKAAQGPRVLSRALQAALVGGMVAGALVAGEGSARAQYIFGAARKPYAVRVGTFVPTNKDVRTVGGTQVLSLGVDWIPQSIPERNAVSVVSLEYIERDKFRLMPVTVGLLTRLNSPELGRTVYYGIGGGLYYTRVAASDTSGKNKWIPGGWIVGGVDLSERYFAEIKYHYVNKYDGKFVGGTQFNIGTRF